MQTLKHYVQTLWAVLPTPYLALDSSQTLDHSGYWKHRLQSFTKRRWILCALFNTQPLRLCYKLGLTNIDFHNWLLCFTAISMHDWQVVQFCLVQVTRKQDLTFHCWSGQLCTHLVAT